MKKAIFLDRDGVINRKLPEHDYVKKWEEMEILPGVDKALSLIKRSGYMAVIVTNQKGVARGKMKAEDVHDVHRRLNAKMKGQIDAFYCCFHSEEDRCECRKPKPGLVHRAVADLEIDVENSWLIGDSVSDIECGLSAGAKVKLMETDGNLWKEVKQIIGSSKNRLARVKLVSHDIKKTLR